MKTTNSSILRNIILTGATGAVGSNILFEMIRKYMDGVYHGKIILLARSSSRYEMTAKERIVQILTNEYAPDYLKSYSVFKMMSFIEVVEAELTCATLSEKLSCFHDLENCYVIHSAATTNLAKNDKAYDQNYAINYLGSLNLLGATQAFIKKFTFISTAYSCGVQSGMVSHNYKEENKDNFRNHYESLKARIEVELEENCLKANVGFQILRPAVVCGRTIDAPLYAIANFHVFYGYAKFFHRIQQKNETNPIHIKYNAESSLHIVPVDYVSKIIVAAFDDDSIKYLTIAPEKGLDMTQTIEGITSDVGYSNSHHTDEMNPDPSAMEAFYYKTTHAVFGDYIDTPQMIFDTKPLEDILPGVPVPEIESHYKALVAYAVALDFETLESVQYKERKEYALLNRNLKKIAG